MVLGGRVQHIGSDDVLGSARSRRAFMYKRAGLVSMRETKNGADSRSYPDRLYTAKLFAWREECCCPSLEVLVQVQDERQS